MWPFTKKAAAVEPTRADIEAQTDAAAVHLPAKPLHKLQTPADVLEYWCAKHKASYERIPGEGFVRVRVHLPTGDTLAGNGPTTAAAVTDVVRKLEAL